MQQTKGFTSPNYTQTPNDFFDMLPEMEDSELRVTLVMIRNTFGFHRDGFKMGIGKLAKAAGLSENGAKAGAKAAEARGTFRRVNPNAITEAEWALVVDGSTVEGSTSDPLPGQSVTPNGSTSESQVGIKERERKGKKGDLVDLLLTTATEKERIEKEATDAFEKAFGFSELPWWTGGSKWDKFLRFVVKVHGEDPAAFKAYVDWRNGEGKFNAMSNKQIRMNPQVFMDTSWAEFVAQYKPAPKPVEYVRADPNAPKHQPPAWIFEKQKELHAKLGKVVGE